jgi:hypothetical protein
MGRQNMACDALTRAAAKGQKQDFDLEEAVA